MTATRRSTSWISRTVHDSIGPIAAVEWISLAWSPDGSSLAYQAGAPAGSNPLTVVELSTGQTHELASGPLGPMSPSVSPWSPDGRWIAIADTGGDLLVVSRDGTERTTVPMPENDGMRIPVVTGRRCRRRRPRRCAHDGRAGCAGSHQARGRPEPRDVGFRLVARWLAVRVRRRSSESTGDLAVVTQAAFTRRDPSRPWRPSRRWATTCPLTGPHHRASAGIRHGHPADAPGTAPGTLVSASDSRPGRFSDSIRKTPGGP